MTEPVTVLDPTAEVTPGQRSLNSRPVGLEGLTVGLLDINKPRGDVFLDRLEERLIGQGALVRRYTKPTFTKPAPEALREEINAANDFVIEALAD